MRRRSMIVGVALLVLVVFIVAGVLIVRSMLSPERFTGMLREQASQAGLRLRLDGPASPTLFPHLAVRIEGLRLSRAGYDADMLTAREARLVVPWSSLLAGQARIERLEITSPRIDLEQIKAWMDGLAGASAAPGPPQLPTVEAGVHVIDGTLLSGSKLLLQSLSLQTGRLHPGSSFRLNLQALQPDNRPLAVQLDTVPTQSDAQITLSPLSLHASAGAPPSLDLQGHLSWRGGLSFGGALDGSLALADGNYDASLHLMPSPHAAVTDGSGRMRVKLDGKDTHMDLELSPVETWQWWQSIATAGSGLPLPPVTGTVRAEHVDAGAVKFQGLQIESGLPASSASTQAPAAAASS